MVNVPPPVHGGLIHKKKFLSVEFVTENIFFLQASFHCHIVFLEMYTIFLIFDALSFSCRMQSCLQHLRVMSSILPSNFVGYTGSFKLILSNKVFILLGITLRNS